MRELLSKITKLIEVKKLIALMVIGVMCGLAIKETISPEAFMNIATLVVGFYFGSSATRQAINETKDK